MQRHNKEAIYIDTLGNDLDRATYESLLAYDILHTPETWMPVFEKINNKLYQVLKENIEYLKKNEKRICKDCTNKTFEELIGTSLEEALYTLKGENSKYDKYPNEQAFNLYKELYENLFKYLYRPKNENKHAAAFDKKALYRDLEDATIYRPRSIFSPINRNRKALHEDKEPPTSPHAGLLSNSATPTNLKNKFPDRYPAKLRYTRLNSEVKTNLPFGSGTSGTVAISAHAVNQLLPGLTPEEYKIFFMALSAHLVYEGHHSFGEAALVVNALQHTYQLILTKEGDDLEATAAPEKLLYITMDEDKNFYAASRINNDLNWESITLSDEEVTALTTGKLTNPILSQITDKIVSVLDLPHIKAGMGYVIDFTKAPKEFYDQLLADNYRNSKQYQQFSSQFHPNKYHGITWELLSEAQTELEACHYQNKDLLKFIAQHRHKEITHAMLEQLNIILIQAKNDKNITPAQNKIFNKVSEKLLSAGFVSSAELEKIQQSGRAKVVKQYEEKINQLLKKHAVINLDSRTLRSPIFKKLS